MVSQMIQNFVHNVVWGHLDYLLIDMPPGTKRSYRVRADALGRWAYHCHLLYHMEAGMMREVRVEE